MIGVRTVEKSRSPMDGTIITTLELTYPRFIHAELLTHRVFSRNSASSRAIPIQKMIDAIDVCPAHPVEWGKNQPGMQAEEEVTTDVARKANDIWYAASRDAIYHAKRMAALGVHKQVVNRLLEPFMHQKTLVTSTEWDNFFKLRMHKDAQPEMRVLAEEMYPHIHSESKYYPCERHMHHPFGSPGGPWQVAVARCARVSYTTHDSLRSKEADMELCNKLQESGHWSPFEHVAVAAHGRHANFTGWRSYRQILEGTP